MGFYCLDFYSAGPGPLQGQLFAFEVSQFLLLSEENGVRFLRLFLKVCFGALI